MPALEKVAKRKKWELCDVIEEAFIHFLNSENIYVPYTKDIKQDGALKKKIIRKTPKKK